VVGIAGVYWNFKVQMARREALGALAAKLGLEFDADEDTSVENEFGQFGCFSTGHSREAYNTVRGERLIAGRKYRVCMGDFTYKTTSTDGKRRYEQTHRFSYLVVRVPFPVIPNLTIRREGILDKLKGALGFDDIDFESEEFSRRFWVTSTDKKFAYDVIE